MKSAITRFALWPMSVTAIYRSLAIQSETLVYTHPPQEEKPSRDAFPAPGPTRLDVKEVAMPTKKFLSVPFATLLAISGILILAAPISAAGREKVLDSFNGKGGLSPSASLILDASGNLYGTTHDGGNYTKACP